MESHRPHTQRDGPAVETRIRGVDGADPTGVEGDQLEVG
jgi:hypothetical protein